MYLYDGGYNRLQYEPALLRRAAKAVAEILPEVLREAGATHVVVTGKSGVSMAFAVSMLIDIKLVVVRKKNESSHGEDIEGQRGTRLGDYIILDDFVSSGRTLDNIIDSINSEALMLTVEPQCKGVLVYKKDVGPDYVYTNQRRKLPAFYTEGASEWA